MLAKPLNKTSTRRHVVTVRSERVRGQKRWVVAWHDADGKQRRRFFRARVDAETDAAARRSEDAEILAAIRARGLTLRAVWEAYTAGNKPAPVAAGPTVAEVIEEVARAKEVGGRSARYVRQLRFALLQFAQGRERARIGAVTTEDLEGWMATKRVASRSTLRARLSSMFSFAVRRGYRPDNPCDRLESIHVQRSTPTVLSVRDAARVLSWTRRHRPRALGAVVLTLMCGLRPEEAMRTTWTAIRIDGPEACHVVVEAQTSKVRQRRVVYPMPAAVAWLRLAKTLGADLPLHLESWRRLLTQLRKRMGWPRWPQDVTRHTSATYWLAAGVPIYEVAEQLGNSPAVLRTHYRALVTREDTARFWGLVPRQLRVVVGHPARRGPADTRCATGPA